MATGYRVEFPRQLPICRFADGATVPSCQQLPSFSRVRAPAGMALDMDTSETGNAVL